MKEVQFLIGFGYGLAGVNVIALLLSLVLKEQEETQWTLSEEEAFEQVEGAEQTQEEEEEGVWEPEIQEVEQETTMPIQTFDGDDTEETCEDEESDEESTAEVLSEQPEEDQEEDQEEETVERTEERSEEESGEEGSDAPHGSVDHEWKTEMTIKKREIMSLQTPLDASAKSPFTEEEETELSVSEYEPLKYMTQKDQEEVKPIDKMKKRWKKGRDSEANKEDVSLMIEKRLKILNKKKDI